MSLIFHVGPPIESQEDLNEKCTEMIDAITLDDVELPAFKKGSQCFTAGPLARWLSRQLSNGKFVNTEPTARLPFTLEERAEVFRLANTVDPAGGDGQLLDNGEPVVDSDSDSDSDSYSDYFNPHLSPLEQAVHDENIEAVEAILHAGGRTRATRLPLGRTLHFATRNKNFAIVRMLQEYFGSFPPKDLYNALMTLASNPHSLDIFRYLVEHNIETIEHRNVSIRDWDNWTGETPVATIQTPFLSHIPKYFYYSLENNDEDIGFYILHKFPHLNFKTYTQIGGVERSNLNQCAEHGQLQIATILLDRYQFSPAEMSSALWEAVAHDKTDVARLLLQRGANITERRLNHAFGRYVPVSEELLTMLNEWFETHLYDSESDSES
jgi:ankyrin repeat protein